MIGKSGNQGFGRVDTQAAISQGDRGSVWAEMKWITALIGIAVVGRIVFVLLNDAFYDDAYITFRYARNLIEGYGLVYNNGEHVYGASSPLYTFLCAGLTVVFGETLLPPITRWLGTVGIILFVLAVVPSLPRNPLAKTLPLIALLNYPRIFYSSIGGMEECLILALMGWSVWAALRRHWYWTGLACGALLFMKVDTVIWCVALFLAVGISGKRIPWRAIVVSLLVALPWVVFSLLYYGSILPHAIEAKRVAYAASSQVSLTDIIGLAAPDTWKWNLWAVAGFGLFTYGAISLSVIRVMTSGPRIMLVFPLYCLGYVLALLLSGTTAVLWARWTVPLWGALLVCSGICLDMVHPGGARSGFANMGFRFRAILVVVMCASLLVPFGYSNRRTLAMGSFREVGTWLRDRDAPDADVLLEPIGMIGFLSGMRIHDFTGLVSSGITAARAEHLSNSWFITYIGTHRPAFVVLREVELTSNEFLYGGYGDGIFTPAGRRWFFNVYREVYRTTGGPVTDRLVVFSRS